MKRAGMIAAVIALGLALATPATAGKPDCDAVPTPPSCTPADEDPPQVAACPTDTWTITGKGMTTFGCLWTPVDNGSAVAKVTISNVQGISGPPNVFVRDDSPGDICVLAQGDDGWDVRSGPEYVASFDLFYDTVPVSTPENPDVLDYSGWLGASYWDFVYDPSADPPLDEAGTHWCAPQDPVLWSIRQDTNGGALHLTVAFNITRGGSFDVTLFPENSQG